MADSINTTIRIRGISDASLEALLDLIKESSIGFVVLDMFETNELPGS